LLMRRLSRMRSSSGEEQQEIILKSLREAEWPVLSRWERIVDMVGLLLLLPVRGETPKCSDTRVCKWRTVWPKYVAKQQRHVKAYTTQDLKALGILSLKVKSWDKRKVGRKTNLILRWGKASTNLPRVRGHLITNLPHAMLLLIISYKFTIVSI
jgi:hypothetical protein